jgi:UPF0271 protein
VDPISAAGPRGVIDLNADVGEWERVEDIGPAEERLLAAVTSVSVASGLHAGGPAVIARTVALAQRLGVAVGAHPGYADRAGFGRREAALEPAELRATLLYQVGAVAAFTGDRGLQHVKPHGAMYDLAARDDERARSIVAAVREYDPRLIHVVLAGSPWERVASEAGARVAREAFADRGLLPDGTLQPRSEPGAVIAEPERVAERAVRLAVDGVIRAVDGSDVRVAADTLCIHGDTPGAADLAELVRHELQRAGVTVRPMGTFLP